MFQRTACFLFRDREIEPIRIVGHRVRMSRTSRPDQYIVVGPGFSEDVIVSQRSGPVRGMDDRIGPAPVLKAVLENMSFAARAACRFKGKVSAQDTGRGPGRVGRPVYDLDNLDSTDSRHL